MHPTVSLLGLISGRLLMVAVLAVAVHAAPAFAANKKDPNKEAIYRMQMQLKQVEDAKSAVEQEKAAMTRELEAFKKKASDLETGTARAQARGAKLEKELDATKSDLSAKLQAAEMKLSEMQQTLTETQRELQRAQGERQRLESNLAARTRFAEACVANNRKLNQYHVELINHAQSQGSFNALLAAEPFTQIKRVEIENILEEYRDRIDAERVGAAPRAADKMP